MSDFCIRRLRLHRIQHNSESKIPTVDSLREKSTLDKFRLDKALLMFRWLLIWSKEEGLP
jgi:hypothetical protein